MGYLEWHAKAREKNSELNAQLGTIIYLPWNIREMIYKAFLDVHVNNIYCAAPLPGESYQEGLRLHYKYNCLALRDPNNEMSLSVFRPFPHIAAHQWYFWSALHQFEKEITGLRLISHSVQEDFESLPLYDHLAFWMPFG